MSKRIHIWTKGKRTVASLLLATTLLVSVAPVVQAEKSQPNATEETQSSTEKVITPEIIRYEGRSRENVAEAVAKGHFKDSKKVIIVNREKFPDAISATNISQGEYPVLYTRASSVSDSTIKLLESMPLDEIYVLGGELSVNKSVVSQLEKETGVKVTRIAGRSRYDANVTAVEENYTTANHVVIASGEVYSDALYGVSYANTIEAPVVLTNTSRLQESTVELLKDLGVDTVTIIGGPLTVTEAVENQLKDLGIGHTRIAGRNRYIGSAKVAKEAYENPENVVVASGEVFSDALVSAPLAQKLDAPILLVRNNRMEDVVEGYLTDSQLSLENVYIQGGPLTILPATENRIKELTTYEKTTNIVSVQRVTEEYETIEEEDDNLPAGETEVIQDGKDGYLTIYEEVTYVNGEEVSRTEIDRTETDPVPEIIRVGTQVTEVEQEIVEENIVEYPTETQEDDTFLEGETEVIQEGVDGYDTVVYEVTYVNGEKVSRNEVSRTTTEPVPEIIRVGTRVDVESIVLSEETLTLTELESYEIGADVLPKNATDKNLVWTSSNDEIVTVDVNGTISAKTAGEATITVSDTTGEITDQLIVTVVEPTILSVDDLIDNITQNDEYKFPTTVRVLMSNETTREVPVTWTQTDLDTSILGTFEIHGTVEGYDEAVILSVTVKEYDPEITTNAYSSVSFNNISYGLSLSMSNNGEKPVQVDKIEYYEQGRLRTTSTQESLENSGIPTVINPGETWGISSSFRIGFVLDGSYVKFYVTANDTNYEYEAHNLNRSW